MEGFRDAQGVHYERCGELEEAYRQLYSTVLRTESMAAAWV